MFDVVVVGLGGVGSFALRSLAHRSKASKGTLRILGIERYQPGHDNGSSHGKSRIYRHAYFEHSDYVPLLRYSTSQFKQLERDTETNLLCECGVLIIDDNDGSTIKACEGSAAKYGIEIERIDAQDELSSRYPQFLFHPNHAAILEHNCGFVRPEDSVKAAVEDASVCGGDAVEIWDKTCVKSIEEVFVENKDNESHVLLTVQSQEEGSNDLKETVIKSKKVIISGGAWTNELLPEWSNHLKVTRQVQGWIDVRKQVVSTESKDDEETILQQNENHQPDKMPVWIFSSEEDVNNHRKGLHMYGMPCDVDGDEPTWIKVALHGRDEVITNPGDVAKRKTISAEDIEELQLASSTFLSIMANSSKSNKSSVMHNPFSSVVSCLYTESTDGNFIVGRPKNNKLVYAAAGLSGHGFKMVPALGKALSDLALDGETSLPIDFLSPSRFGI